MRSTCKKEKDWYQAWLSARVLAEMGRDCAAASSKDKLLGRRWLNDKHIDYTQSMLKKTINGCGSTLLVTQINQKDKQAIQAIHCRNNHWSVASNLHCSDGQKKVFDSLYISVDEATKKKYHIFLKLLTLVVVPIHKQTWENDCGLFAVAIITALAFRSCHFQQDKMRMRPHLVKCLRMEW